MPRGGSRPGAGRKPGSAAAHVQKIRTVARAKLAEYLNSGRDPLQVLIDLAFNDDVEVALRIQAAGMALPFLHPKLSQQTINSTSIHAQVDQRAVIENLQARFDRLAAPAAGPVIEAAPIAAAAEGEG